MPIFLDQMVCLYNGKELPRMLLDDGHTRENPYYKGFDCKKVLESVMCTDSDCRLGAVNLS